MVFVHQVMAKVVKRRRQAPVSKPLIHAIDQRGNVQGDQSVQLADRSFPASHLLMTEGDDGIMLGGEPQSWQSAK